MIGTRAVDQDTGAVRADPVQAFRDAMAQLASAVSLFTLYLEPDGERAADDLGMTVTSLASASLHPPMVTIGIGSGTSMAPVVRPGLAAGISVFAARHRELAADFARSGRPRADVLLDGIGHHRAANGALLLDDALAVLEARVEAVVPAGDHHIAILEVLRSDVPAAGEPLLYQRRSYL